MRINILSDSHGDAHLDRVLNTLSDIGYRRYFGLREYGSGLTSIVIILMCRNPEIKFKQRIMFAKKTRTLYADIMFDLNAMRQCDDKQRLEIVVQRLSSEIPSILRKYALKEFDEARFVADFRNWLAEIEPI